MLIVIPGVKFRLVLGGHIDGVDQESARILGSPRIAVTDKRTFDAQKPSTLPSHPLRPYRQVVISNGPVGGAVQHVDRIQIVGRHRFPTLAAEPTPARPKARYSLALRDML